LQINIQMHNWTRSSPIQQRNESLHDH